MSYQSNIFDLNVKKTSRKIYANLMKRNTEYSAILNRIPVRFGEPVSSEAKIYRKFFYNQHGKVTKKLDFDASGAITMKEVYKFDKQKILKSTFITSTKFWTEDYTYNEQGQMEKYRLQAPEQSNEKRTEIYTFDNQGRKKDKTSIGLGGIKELFTKYIYIGKSPHYTFREVTNSNDVVQITLVYIRDKKGNQTGLYGFSNQEYPAVAALMKKPDWENQSDFRTEWTYDKNSNQTHLLSDIKIPTLLSSPTLRKLDFDKTYGYSTDKPGRIITQKSSSEYEKLKGEFYLISTTEWSTRFDEPVQEIKTYTYFDKDGKQLSTEC